MKKIGTLYRESSERELKDRMGKASSMFIIGYSGIKSNDLNALRNKLRLAGAELFVPKNSLVSRVLKDRKLSGLTKFVQGPCGFVFSLTDPTGVSKVLKQFSKDNDKLLLHGGVMEEAVLESKDISALASLPPREVLYVMLVTGLKSPITSSVRALKQMMTKMVVALNRIKENKGK
ncbi:MAG: 50S ribosomal protein L10 [Candidatus Omnitrophica bacterium]|nr:50S ribosomal protein L10 [Candidatus Omnitrophota bacterium]